MNQTPPASPVTQPHVVLVVIKNFIIATPEDSLAITGEQAAVLYGELGQHLGHGSETGGARPSSRAEKVRKPKTSKPV